ncbi:hypothetical protein [Salinibacterium sp. ZJ450]|uniref:hypothetical protein n=1 Tax=Salinibacterium sp. ZJ450 TaxID=2708338 RepID=UPI0014244440|nr:hypothetical protein [Salinibacterium sp. ZJ450]
MQRGLSIAEQVYEQPADTNDRLLFNGARTFFLDQRGVLLQDMASADLSALAGALVNRVAELSNNYTRLP